MDELGEISLKERNPQKASAIRDELDQRFYSACEDRRAFFRKFFEDKIEVESSWENQNRVVESIARIVTWQLSRLEDFKVTEKKEKKIEEESERVFLYAKVFGPMKIPGEDKRTRTVYENGEFLEWAEQAMKDAGFQGMWRLVGKTIMPLASEEDVSRPSLRPKGLVRDGAPKTVGLSNANSIVPAEISQCNQCGRKFLSLGMRAPAKCPCESGKNLASEGGTVYRLAQGPVDFPVFNPLDLEDSLHTGEVWRTSQEEAREIIVRCRLPSGHGLSCYEGGILLSIFAGFLCVASGTKVTPSNIARVVTEEKYKNRLVEKARRKPLKVANRLKKRENMRRITVAFWE